MEGNLPVHLEAGPLIRDPHDAATLYAGFSLTPYGEVWRRADEGSNLLSQIDPISLRGRRRLPRPVRGRRGARRTPAGAAAGVDRIVNPE